MAVVTTKRDFASDSLGVYLTLGNHSIKFLFSIKKLLRKCLAYQKLVIYEKIGIMDILITTTESDQASDIE